jgi:hypothetical protein
MTDRVSTHSLRRANGGMYIHVVDNTTKQAVCGHLPADTGRKMKRGGWVSPRDFRRPVVPDCPKCLARMITPEALDKLIVANSPKLPKRVILAGGGVHEWIGIAWIHLPLVKPTKRYPLVVYLPKPDPEKPNSSRKRGWNNWKPS